MVEGGQVTPYRQDPVTAGLARPAGRRQQPQLPRAPHGRGPVTDLKLGVDADGISHWGDAQVLASLTASVVLLVSFVLIEMRSSHPLLPMRLLADRNRSGAYLIMLCIATGLFGLFFFLTLFIQTVLGYSAIRAGIAYLPFAVGVVIASALASPLVARIGPRPLILAGAAMVAGGMFWFSRLTEHSGYAGHLLGPQLVSSFGLGLVFVPLALVALHNVAEQDSGVASSLLNAAQQVGDGADFAVGEAHSPCMLASVLHHRRAPGPVKVLVACILSGGLAWISGLSIEADTQR